MSLSRNFSYCSWGFQGKNTEVVWHSLLQWTTFCQTSPPWPARLGWPHRAWLSYIELDQAVVLVWLDWLVFCNYGFSVSALWCPLATLTILLGFLLPWTWGISSRLLQQSTPAAPHCEGYLLTAAPPDLERGVVPLGPPALTQPLLLGHEVAPLEQYSISIVLMFWTEMLVISHIISKRCIYTYDIIIAIRIRGKYSDSTNKVYVALLCARSS